MTVPHDTDSRFLGGADRFSLDDMLLNHEGMSEARRAIAEYICGNPWEAIKQSAAEIGAATGVSASTVVRFAQGIGFEGLSDLQDKLASHVGRLLRSRESNERVKFAAQQLGLEGTEDSWDVFERVASAEATNIEHAFKRVDPAAFNAAVRMLTGAGHVHVLGLRGSISLATHFMLGLRYVRPHVFTLDNAGDDLPDKLASLGPTDLLVAFSYSPYTSTTIETAKVCREIGVPVLAITDSSDAPILNHASVGLVTGNPVWFTSANAGTTALVNALVFAAAASIPKEAAAHVDHARSLVERLERLELTNMDNLMSLLIDRRMD